MLTHLNIRNFAIADQIDIELSPGMTAITGETGAGKSIILDALGYTLGNRADAGVVRHGSERAEISASFDISKIKEATTWLDEQELSEGNECVLRRIITAEGRSRAFINGQSVPLQQLKQLGDLLLDLHSQHEHHSLMKTDTHRRLLDEFASHQSLVDRVTSAYQAWRRLYQKLHQAQNQQQDQDARVQLLRYQIQELSELDLQPGEVESLEQEQKKLANGEQILTTCQQVSDLCEGDSDGFSNSLLTSIQQCSQKLASLDLDELTETRQLFSDASIQLEEAISNLSRFQSDFELDAERLQFVNERLSVLYDLARKHQVKTEQLPEKLKTLEEELEQLAAHESSLQEWQQQLEQLYQQYQQLCQQLSQQRQHAAKKFDQRVTEQMQHLSLKGAKLETRLTPLSEDRFAAFGMEDVEFLVITNPGQPAQPLNKIASGGELSRISLAIQIISAENSRIPTLIFDEVDVGISGGTSELVGRMLRHLGEQGQVLCVTHQPQVASQGHQHLRVSKELLEGTNTMTRVKLEHLSEQDRIDEVARLLGGLQITDQTMAHAREMVVHGQLAH